MNLPFTEKYRPKTFEQVVGVEELDRIKKLCINLSSSQNILFFGPAGTGKTTVAKIIIADNQPVDVLKINGSSQAGIEFVREQLVPFCSSSSIGGKKRIVFIDEFDGVTPTAFKALRETIERYAYNVVFICTCNYLDKIPEPIQSRFAKFEFKRAGKKDLVDRLRFVVSQENICVESEDVFEVIFRKSRGDIRDALNILQKSGKDIKVSDVKNIDDKALQVLLLIKNKQWKELRLGLVYEVSDFEECLVEMDDLIQKTAKFSDEQKRKANAVIADYLFRFRISTPMKVVQFSACCAELMGVL